LFSTKIKDDTDPNDRGVQERKALFQTMMEVNTKRVEQGLQPIRSISRIHNTYYKAPNKQPAGVDSAIINGRSSAASANEEGEIDYLRDIKGKGWKSFLKLGR